MYVHVKSIAGLELESGGFDPLALVAASQVALTHSECVAGAMTIEQSDPEHLTLVCSKCQARQQLDREEAIEALCRVIEHEEYAWAGEAGFLPD